MATALSGADLVIRTGKKPASCAAGDAGEEIVSIKLPAASAAGGVLTLVSKPVRAIAGKAGQAGHFRIYANGRCQMQGAVGGAGADLPLPSTAIEEGQMVEISSWIITEGNT